MANRTRAAIRTVSTIGGGSVRERTCFLMTALNDGDVVATSTAQHHLLYPLAVPCVHAARGVPAGKSALGNTCMQPQLSAREVEVLRAWLMTDSKREAGARLFISEATVSTHLTRIKAKYAKAGRPARTKAALFVRAVQDGHTTLDEY